MALIGFIGTGKMGFGMASQLLKAGHQVNAFNRTLDKAKPLVDFGAKIANTPKQAAEGADVIISMVGDDKASRSIWLGANGALAAERKNEPIIIECSTISHDWVIELSTIVANHGFSYLDCPVTGLPHAAARGELTLFLGGSSTVIKSAQPYLSQLSTTQLHFGDIGAGTAFKLIANLMGTIQIAAIAEALLLAEKVGLDLKMVLKALGQSGSGCPQVKRNGKLMVSAEHEKNIMFPGNWRFKDATYGIELAKKMNQKTPLGEVAKTLFQHVVDSGNGDLAESKVIDIIKDL